MEFKRCPMCGEQYTGYPATSRTRGREDICPDCGTKQAITLVQIVLSAKTMTAGISAWMANSQNVRDFVVECFNRHLKCDWGDMDPEDIHSNDSALSTGCRLFSSYNIPQDLASTPDGDNKVWIITEADRSSTTILFPSEY